MNYDAVAKLNANVFLPHVCFFARCQKMALCRLLLSQNSTGCYSKPVGCSGPTESKPKGGKQNMPLGEKKTEEVRTQLKKKKTVI